MASTTGTEESNQKQHEAFQGQMGLLRMSVFPGHRQSGLVAMMIHVRLYPRTLDWFSQHVKRLLAPA